MNILATLRNRFGRALGALGVAESETPELLAMVLPSQDAKFGDYQANVAMPLGKRLGQPPREIAAELVRLADVADLCEPLEIAGPGFINLRLRDDWLAQQVTVASVDVERVGVAQTATPRTFVLDYSSPNVAKPMHVGHIRSTVIGDALYRILRFLGHRTISDNHLGDWGTQFGMIIYGYKHFVDRPALARKPVDELTRLYKLVNTLVEYHETANEKIPAVEKRIADGEQLLAKLRDAAMPADAKAAKQAAKRVRQLDGQLSELRSDLDELLGEVAAVEDDPPMRQLAVEHADIGQRVLLETALLHGGDPTNVELWRQFLPACLLEIETVYKRLGVSFDHTLGESFYQDRLRGVVKDLADKGLARESDGAICVFLDGYDVPMIVQKQDGAFLYATTDLATIQYRMREWHPDAILYVVDHRQSLHFDQLFTAARLWGYRDVELQHIAFGTVLGDDGKPFKTRSGTSVGLAGLLDEAVERAYAIVSQNDAARPEPLLSEEDRRHVAERIGIGAIKYADLAHNRTSDYVFSYDKMLAMTGNTATYMQYSYARVRSIFAKAGADAHSLERAGASPPPRVTSAPHGGEDAPARSNAILLSTPQERALAVALLQFSEALDRVVADYRPNHLTGYLFELATRYSDFFENCPVLRAESDELRMSRLLLCDLTARTLQQGLNLLGIEVVERM
ncbi:MAG: arginine--tRNA ligase [Planctomycetes bacterium]|nr:arginine--tRNA ligase [Planctomycetota bacterium]